jgi:hypothetical protein
MITKIEIRFDSLKTVNKTRDGIHKNHQIAKIEYSILSDKGSNTSARIAIKFEEHE